MRIQVSPPAQAFIVDEFVISGFERGLRALSHCVRRKRGVGQVPRKGGGAIINAHSLHEDPHISAPSYKHSTYHGTVHNRSLHTNLNRTGCSSKDTSIHQRTAAVVEGHACLGPPGRDPKPAAANSHGTARVLAQAATSDVAKKMK